MGKNSLSHHQPLHTITVAILAQGTSWADAVTQAFFALRRANGPCPTRTCVVLLLRLGQGADMMRIPRAFAAPRASGQSQHRALATALPRWGRQLACHVRTWCWRARELRMRCSLCGWYALTKQVVCKDPSA